MKLPLILGLSGLPLMESETPQWPSQAQANGAWDDADYDVRTPEPGSKATSDIVWRAFHDLNLRDWYAGIDPEIVFAKVKELISTYNLDPGYAERYARKNYDSFLELHAEGEVDDWGNCPGSGGPDGCPM